MCLGYEVFHPVNRTRTFSRSNFRAGSRLPQVKSLSSVAVLGNLLQWYCGKSDTRTQVECPSSASLTRQYLHCLFRLAYNTCYVMHITRKQKKEIALMRRSNDRFHSSGVFVSSFRVNISPHEVGSLEWFICPQLGRKYMLPNLLFLPQVGVYHK